MAFQDEAVGLRSRLHLEGARLPAAIGVLLAALAVTACALVAASGALAPAQLEVRRAADAPAAEEAPANAEEEPPEPALAYVHVGGAVASPGVYAVLGGSRVDDALAAAGGLAADAAPDAVNRARVVSDGEQVVVPTVEEAAAAPAASPGAATPGAGGAAARVNLNTAGAAELTTLNGIGEATAAKIIADREANGPFATVDELTRVSGIGERKLAALRDAVCV